MKRIDRSFCLLLAVLLSVTLCVPAWASDTMLWLGYEDSNQNISLSYGTDHDSGDGWTYSLVDGVPTLTLSNFTGEGILWNCEISGIDDKLNLILADGTVNRLTNNGFGNYTFSVSGWADTSPVLTIKGNGKLIISASEAGLSSRSCYAIGANGWTIEGCTIVGGPNEGDEESLTLQRGDACTSGGEVAKYAVITGNSSYTSLAVPPSTSAPTLPDAPPTDFIDVPMGTYYEDAVKWAVKTGVTNGTSATTFSPNDTCTRGQVATFLWRANGRPQPQTTVNPFTDVDPSSAFYSAILWAYENGITAGTSATTFSPGNPCTRGHVTTFLWRSEGGPAAFGNSTLASTFPQGYYTDAVAWADIKGILRDTSDPFDPADLCPRSDIVTYLYRALA